jgi:hypothetical protein
MHPPPPTCTPSSLVRQRRIIIEFSEGLVEGKFGDNFSKVKNNRVETFFHLVYFDVDGYDYPPSLTITRHLPARRPPTFKIEQNIYCKSMIYEAAF